jgi:hypothetical protein
MFSTYSGEGMWSIEINTTNMEDLDDKCCSKVYAVFNP